MRNSIDNYMNPFKGSFLFGGMANGKKEKTKK